MQRHGRNKVLCGTNFPMIQPADCLKELESLGLDEETQQKFLHENAVKVFQIEKNG
jgi:predicted TIM-barrel fold metal-dependent hydrolase